jgi:acetyl-CoA carboxylase biotin carboxyl carrier protein
VRELEVATPGLRIAVRRALDADFQKFVGPAGDPPAAAGDVGEELGLHAIRCPLTGIWYDAPSPGAPPFIRVGDFIGAGTVIGLLETMKVFNEVHSDAAGIVRQVLVRKGDLVLAHAPLATLDLTSPTPPLGVGELA